jgi:membrane protein implicated in regulation of membrane protease activity
MKHWWIGKVAGMFGIFVVGALLLALVVMLLWNALVPDIFHGGSLTYVQALGLLILSHILLRGWSPWRHRNGWRREHWRKRFEEKLAAMAPEEREKFREEWGHRCGWHSGTGEESKSGQA